MDARETIAEAAEFDRDHGLAHVGIVPRLSGRWLTAFRIIWFAALALAVIGPPASLYYREKNFSRTNLPFNRVGLRTPTVENGRVVLTGTTDSEAWTSGLRRGDRLLAVDGRPIPDTVDTTDGIAASLEGSEGSVVTVRTRSADGRIHDHALHRSAGHVLEPYAGSGMDPATGRRLIAGISLIPTLVLITAAVVLFSRRSWDWVAAGLSLSFLFAASSIGPQRSVFALLGAEGIGTFLNVLGGLMLVLVLLVFPEGRFAPRWTRWVAVLLLPMAPLSYSGLLGPLQPAIGLAFFAVAVYSVGHRYRQLGPGLQRQQIRWAFLGFLFFLLLLAAGAALGALLSFQDAAGPLSVWLYLLLGLLFAASFSSLALGLLVSLLRYRLYDVDAAISRSVAYGALTLMLLAVFAGSEKVIELLGEEYFGESLGALAGGIGAALAAVMIVPLHHRVSHWAEKRFQKQLIKLRHGLPLLVGDLRETAGLERIAAAVLESVMQGVRANRAALIVGEEVQAARGVEAEEVDTWRATWTPAAHHGLDCDRRDPLFPMRVPLEADGHGRLGWLLLGPRPDGSLHGKDEREALAEIADPVARAVQIVRLREEREHRLELRAAQQEQRLSSVEQTLMALGHSVNEALWAQARSTNRKTPSA